MRIRLLTTIKFNKQKKKRNNLKNEKKKKKWKSSAYAIRQ